MTFDIYSKYYEPVEENMNLILQAANLAKRAHAKQVRKFSGDPYITHCLRVANKVMLLDGITEEMVAAALLHDVIEDCDNEFVAELHKVMPARVTNLVLELTNQFTKKLYPNYNREKRKNLENKRIATVSQEAKIIKLCDRIDNLHDFIEYNELYPAYTHESYGILAVCHNANEDLKKELKSLLYWVDHSYKYNLFTKEELKELCKS